MNNADQAQELADRVLKRATGLFMGTGVAPSSAFQWSRLAQAAILHVALYFVLAILIQA